MHILGEEAQKGDQITLSRGKNRITVTYGVPIFELINGRDVGFQDDTGQSWYTSSDYKVAWSPVGLEKAGITEPELAPLPTRVGYYAVLDSSVEDDPAYFVVERDSEGWREAGSLNDVLSEETIRGLDFLTPLYYAEEHFTAISSDGKTIYNLVLAVDGDSVSCNCKGFEFRSKCRHAEAYITALSA